MAYPERFQTNKWLPTTLKEVKNRGWEQLDVVLFTGDAYVDHPSFGVAVVGRVLESLELKVAIVPQPNWQDDGRDFKKMGQPRLFFGVTGGNMDSMVNHYTANKRLRSNDAYTAGGAAGARPDYASYEYCRQLKKFFPDVPIILGGVEASLRRVVHYDYWSDLLKPSILFETQADLLIYGMAEQSLVELVDRLEKGEAFHQIKDIPQTCYSEDTQNFKVNSNDIELHSWEDCKADAILYAKNFKQVEVKSNSVKADRLYQAHANTIIVINPPYPPAEDGAIDRWYDLPYTRLPHPKYWKKGSIPAYEMIKFSINMHRGCFGGCSFCTISAHQGKFIANRSEQSILKELEQVVNAHDFKGYISDLGGPSANMYRMKGKDLSQCETCKRPSCIFPNVCNNLDTSHQALMDLYLKVREHPKVKKAFIGSGIRYDLAMAQEPKQRKLYLQNVMRHHVSGKLKVAPEHTSNDVLKLMRKPDFKLFEEFTKLFNTINREDQLNELLIPYFISSHPGSKTKDMADLAIKTKAMNFRLEQVQDFTPTPMTVATVIYYSGVHPYTLKPVETPKTQDEKRAQRMFFFWYDHQYKKAIIERLKKEKLSDLIPIVFEKPKSGKF
ncbi:MAG: YgiQ family radical SAM protein [Bacteroidales bacterium]|nr:YgiQ family radical SAM protein [Bacteroidales bacterium]